MPTNHSNISFNAPAASSSSSNSKQFKVVVLTEADRYSLTHLLTHSPTHSLTYQTIEAGASWFETHNGKVFGAMSHYIDV
jgi:hypothetical protein